MAEITWVFNQGEEGVELRGRLSDGSGRINLDDYDDLTVTVRKTLPADPVIDDELCVKDLNQDEENETDGKGWFTYIVTAADALLEAGHYHKMRFKLMDGAEPRYFPKKINGQETYGKLIIREP